MADADRTTLSAIGVTTWATKWTVPYAAPVMALAGGGVATHTNNTIVVRADDGSVLDTAPMSLRRPTSRLQFGMWQGGAPDGLLASVAGPELHEAVFWFQRSGNQLGTAAPRTYHRSVDRAAVTTEQYYNPVSVRTDREFGGSICSLAYGYYGNVPNVSNVPDTVNPNRDCEGNRVGDYHTHGRYGNEGFSAVDVQRINSDQIDSMYIPHYVASPCGRIYKGVGPNMPFEGYTTLPDRTDTSVRCIQ